MKYVEVYKLQNDGSQTVIATCHLDGEAVKCEGDEIFVKNLEADGIGDYSSDERAKLTFADGEKFLEQMKFNFKSGYLNASEIKEK